MATDEKSLLEAFFKQLEESSLDWLRESQRFDPETYRSKAVSNVSFSLELRYINQKISGIREELKVYYESYQEFMKDYGINSLSEVDWGKYHEIADSLEKGTLPNIKKTGQRYRELLEVIKEFHGEEHILKFIKPINRDAILRLEKMELTDLLQLLEDANLAGF